MKTELRPSSHVYHATVEGLLVLLDVRTEQYYVLDPVGTSMWTHVLALGDRPAALRALRDEFSVDPARLEGDFEQFLQRCLRDGFLEEGAEPPTAGAPAAGAPPRGTRFLAARAWWSLIGTARSLRTKGFAHTYQTYRDLPAPADDPPDAEGVLRGAVAAFALAENFCPLKRAPKDCLARSLALFRFLRAAGLRAEHCIGVNRFPFHAHAWVEHRGHIVYDNPSLTSIYTTLARIRPR